MRSLCLFLLATAAALAQPFSVGVKAGVPLTDFFTALRSPTLGYSSVTNRYIIGPTAELHLPFGLGVEFDVLYRHLDYASSGNLVDIFVNQRTTAGAWEFPLLLKYRIPSRILRPYVDAGIAWDTLSGLKNDISRLGVPLGSTSGGNPAELQNTTTKGFVIGAGIDVHALVLHLSPEIRYTRWGAQHFADVNGLLRSNQNQGEFLLGITF